MDNSNIDPKLLTQLSKLEAKYQAMGQDLSSYLDGLLYADYLTYWDYIHLDTLLSLQSPRTDFPDEKIFILYHQITELYFKLILHEQEQLIATNEANPNIFLKRINRINRYFEHLISSFDVMIDGMDSEQFLAFRMSLLPSSGFQSAQYRMIEINSTDFSLLMNYQARSQADALASIEEIYQNIYWKRGATELASGNKTLTLKQFEKKYAQAFIEKAGQVKDTNFRQLYLRHHKGNDVIAQSMKVYDDNANVRWPLVHMRSASRYLQRDPEVIKATGGTNWQQYLPPRKQMIVYYPELWSEDERDAWGTSIKPKTVPS
jgi:tryptophan 2,3-dioxygenase